MLNSTDTINRTNVRFILVALLLLATAACTTTTGTMGARLAAEPISIRGRS